MENHLWGAPRIHGELLKLGIVVSERTVSRYLPNRGTAPSQTWRTFLANHFVALASTSSVTSNPVATENFVHVRRLRLRAFSDSLQLCAPSSSRCSTRFDLSFGPAPRCIWKSSRSATSSLLSIDRGARVFASRRPIESFGRRSHTPGAAGARPFTSSNASRDRDAYRPGSAGFSES